LRVCVMEVYENSWFVHFPFPLQDSESWA
jgi:hypothetical protein